MPPKILRRCDCCKNWHASFLIIDPQGNKLYYCRRCHRSWQERQLQQPPKTPPASTT